jgi:hypothetical protein
MAGERIDCAFIDGEHTNVATFSDLVSIYPMLSPKAIVGFHDANLISDSILNISTFLRSQMVRHEIFFVPDVVCILSLGSSVDVCAAALADVSKERTAAIKIWKQGLRENKQLSGRDGPPGRSRFRPPRKEDALRPQDGGRPRDGIGHCDSYTPLKVRLALFTAGLLPS